MRVEARFPCLLACGPRRLTGAAATSARFKMVQNAEGRNGLATVPAFLF